MQFSQDDCRRIKDAVIWFENEARYIPRQAHGRAVDTGDDILVLRVTGAPSGLLYPAVLTQFDVALNSWADGASVWSVGSNAEALVSGTRYSARCCYGSAGSPAAPVFMTFGDTTAAVLPAVAALTLQS